MLRLDGLKVTQGTFELVADVAFERGRCTALIGPSGAGKSTALAAIAGFVPLTRGRIIWCDEDLSDLAPGERGMSMLFQDGNVFPHLTVFQNVALGLSPQLRLDADMKRRVHAALERVGLAGMGGRKPSALSGGQIARVALARSLAQACPIMVLDEPFAALGPALKIEMLSLVQEVAVDTNATVLMVSHDPDDAKRIADNCALVADGVVSAPVPKSEFFDNPPPALRAYLGT